MVDIFDLLLLEINDNSERNSKHDESNQESAENSSTIMYTFDVSVLPNDVGWVSGLLKTWNLIQDSFVNELFGIGVVGIPIEGILLVVKKSFVQSIIGVESNESTNWSCQIFVIILIYFSIFGHNQIVDLLIINSHFIPLAICDSVSSSSQQIDKLMVVVSKLDIENFDYIS